MTDVNVPGAGKVDRRVVIGVGVAVVGLLGYMWWRRQQLPSTTDIAAGADGALYDTAEGSGAYQNPNPRASGSDSVDESDSPDTQMEWTDLATSKLIEQGRDPAYVGLVLGKYLAGLALTSEEAALVRTAWAYAGKPPGGPDSITLVTSDSTPGQRTTPGRRPLPQHPTPPVSRRPLFGDDAPSRIARNNQGV